MAKDGGVLPKILENRPSPLTKRSDGKIRPRDPVSGADSPVSTAESLHREASRRFGRERADALRPFLEQLAADVELLVRVPFAPDDEPA